MKKLIFVLFLLSFNVNAQNKVQINTIAIDCKTLSSLSNDSATNLIRGVMMGALSGITLSLVYDLEHKKELGFSNDSMQSKGRKLLRAVSNPNISTMYKKINASCSAGDFSARKDRQVVEIISQILKGRME